MTFEELGGVGEFVGALAVLASLVYLATEVRRNTKTTRLATLQAALGSAQLLYDAPAHQAGMLDKGVLRLTQNRTYPPT